MSVEQIKAGASKISLKAGCSETLTRLQQSGLPMCIMSLNWSSTYIAAGLALGSEATLVSAADLDAISSTVGASDNEETWGQYRSLVPASANKGVPGRALSLMVSNELQLGEDRKTDGGMRSVVQSGRCKGMAFDALMRLKTTVASKIASSSGIAMTAPSAGVALMSVLLTGALNCFSKTCRCKGMAFDALMRLKTTVASKIEASSGIAMTAPSAGVASGVAMTNPSAGVASGVAMTNPSAGVAYIGDSASDLLPLLKADYGIVLGKSSSLRKVAKQFGITFAPLCAAPRTRDTACAKEHQEHGTRLVKKVKPAVVEDYLSIFPLLPTVFPLPSV
eukprot:gene6919-30900_t